MLASSLVTCMVESMCHMASNSAAVSETCFVYTGIHVSYLVYCNFHDYGIVIIEMQDFGK